MKKRLMKLYLEYVNDYLTVQAIADSYDMEASDMLALLEMGKKYHELNLKQQ